MSKYDILGDWLRNQRSSPVSLLFDDIEDRDRIGVKLPMTARQRREWWGNESTPASRHVQSKAWLSAGWRVEDVDFRRELVVFVRQA
jgi:hypothetical protein